MHHQTHEHLIFYTDDGNDNNNSLYNVKDNDMKLISCNDAKEMVENWS